jgi:hypothetical protein
MLVHLLLFFLIQLPNTFGIVEDFYITFRTQYTLIDNFGFLEGGSINLLYTNQDNRSLTIVFCTDGQMQNVFGKVDACENNLIQPGNCAFLASSNIDGVISFYQEVNFEDNLNMIMTSCTSGSFGGQIEYTFLNPGGEQLSSGDIPLPRLFFVIAGLWLLLNVLWCWNWIKNRSQKSYLHRIISLYPFTKLLEVVMSGIYWILLSKNGQVNVATIVFFLYLFHTFQMYILHGLVVDRLWLGNL